VPYFRNAIDILNFMLTSLNSMSNIFSCSYLYEYFLVAKLNFAEIMLDNYSLKLCVLAKI
jgi:hypothetical protein